MRRFRTSSRQRREFTDGHHRFEHWYRDNSVYFITARCRDRFCAFKSDEAKSIFWNRFDHYCAEFNSIPWITSLVDNHYHTLGYIRDAQKLGKMMQRIHGSIAKLTNDLLPVRHLPFWREEGGNDYFDGCIRNELQCRRAYRYTLIQGVRHGYCKDYRSYAHTHVNIEFERGVRRALKLKAFLEDVPYPRYQ